MNEPKSINKYELAREVLTKELVRLGGEMVTQALSRGQLEELRKIDPAQAKSIDWMNALIGGLTNESEPLHRYVALGEVLLELKELQGRTE
jgi:hypothetical protein